MRAMVLQGLRTGLAVALLALASPALAIEDYDDCLALIAQDADKAQREAGEWARFGGGAPARHCYALALIEFGAPLRAADELIGIAQDEADLSDKARADILVQAGELLVTRDQVLTASVVADAALRLLPEDAGALGLKGAALLEDGQPAAALGILNKALAKSPKRVRLLMRRARAQRGLGNAVAARDDASYAAELAPDRAGPWAELGRAQAALGFKRDARQSFLKAIALDRKGPIGRGAQVALQRMDAGVKP